MTTAPVSHEASHGAGDPRRPLWPWIALGVVVVLLVVGFFAVDAFARGVARDEIASRVVTGLGLPPGTPVEVQVGGGPVLFQLAAGRLDQVDIGVPDAVFGDLSGDLQVHAEGVPLDPSKPTTLVEARFAMPESTVASFQGSLSGVPLDSVTLEDPDIVATASFSLFGIPVPVSLGLEPSATAGQLVFTPTSISVGNQQFSADELKSAPGLGILARPLLKQQAVCIARNLPAPLKLTNMTVEGKELVAQLEAHNAPLNDFATKGTCSAG